MTTTITTDFTVGATVYHVSATEGVREGVVKTIDINVPITGIVNMSVVYNVVFTTTSFGSVDADEADLFADIDLALAAYKLLI